MRRASLASVGFVSLVALLVAIGPDSLQSHVIRALVIATIWFGRRSAKAYAHARETISTVNAEFQESISGVREAQAYVQEDRAVDSFRTTAKRYLDARIQTQVL